jgi:hypothetical protein
VSVLAQNQAKNSQTMPPDLVYRYAPTKRLPILFRKHVKQLARMGITACLRTEPAKSAAPLLILLIISAECASLNVLLTPITMETLILAIDPALKLVHLMLMEIPSPNNVSTTNLQTQPVQLITSLILFPNFVFKFAP